MRRCEVCGWQVNPITGLCYCSIEKKKKELKEVEMSDTSRIKVCKHCGREFEVRLRQQKYCSEECATEKMREQKRESARRRKEIHKRGLQEMARKYASEEGDMVAVISKEDGRYLIGLQRQGQKVEEFEVRDVIVLKVEKVKLEI